jgi:hypothetical protein
MIKVRLQIITQSRGQYFVSVYKVVGNAHIHDDLMSGRISQIKERLERKYEDTIEIEHSEFQGWY